MKKVAHQFFEDDGLDYEDMLNNFDDFCDHLKTVHHKHIIKEIKIMDELLEKLNEQEKTLLWLSEKLNNLELQMEKLGKPSLMYHRPTCEEYETIAQTLDYLHNNVEGLKEDLMKIARAV